MGPRKRPNGTIGTNGTTTVSREYMDMLKDYKRDTKRQKSEEKKASATPPPLRASISPSPPPPPPPVSGHEIELDSDSDMDSDEFEDVELNDSDHSDAEVPANDVVISMNASQAAHLSKKPRQKSTLPKSHRILLHKIALIAWVYHARMRNTWLRDPQLLQSSVLKNVLPTSVLAELFPPEHLTPFLKSKQLVEGLRHAVEVWQHRFKVLRPGLASNNSLFESEGSEVGDPSDFEEYKQQLLFLRGSVDLEGQAFVALLRSLGLRTRLVCSLQPPDNLSADAPTTTSTNTSATASSCPIFWSEVWDEHVERWIAVDTVTSTVRLPTRNKLKLKLEPPQSDRFNILRYCIAINQEDNSLRDVTRRYSSNYNGRTRKKRLPHVESEEWLDRFFGVYAPKHFTQADRDEITELSRYPRLEGIPSRVQDFVGHPEYALAEQLKRTEVLRPGAQPCGILSARGKSQPKPSYIYHRDDVLTARSAQSWYKRGRSVRLGAQPRTRRDHKNKLTGETESVALYTFEQTELYRPEPVGEDGTVPKSQYRTIDIFMDSMIPEGAVYIKSKYGKEASKILRIDFANAVTGVDYGKRGPQSRMFGVVVARQFMPAMNAVISGLHDMEAETLQKNEDFRILMLWRKYIMGIQIWERVEKMNPSSTSEANNKSHEHTDEAEEMMKVPLNGPIEHNTENDLEYKIDNADDAEFKPTLNNNNDDNHGDGDRSHDDDLHIVSEEPVKRRHITIDTADLLRIRRTFNLHGDLPGMQIEPPAVSTPSTSISAIEQPATPKVLPDSPGSYHSFSDLDVDEISESEL